MSVEEEQASAPSSMIQIDDPVHVERPPSQQLKGVVTYLGPVEFAEGDDWVGVRLIAPYAGMGKNDGSVQGTRYFTCGHNCGVFVRAAHVTPRPLTRTEELRLKRTSPRKGGSASAPTTPLAAKKAPATTPVQVSSSASKASIGGSASLPSTPFSGGATSSPPRKPRTPRSTRGAPTTPTASSAAKSNPSSSHSATTTPTTTTTSTSKKSATKSTLSSSSTTEAAVAPSVATRGAAPRRAAGTTPGPSTRPTTRATDSTPLPALREPPIRPHRAPAVRNEQQQHRAVSVPTTTSSSATISFDSTVNPCTHGVALSLALLSSVLSLTIAVTLFVIPEFLIDLVFAHETVSDEEGLSALELTLARFMGGVLLALSLTSLSLVLMSLCSKASNTAYCRTALNSHAILGLVLVLVALSSEGFFGNDSQEADAADMLLEYIYLLGCGGVFLLLSCLGLMASFWPAGRSSRRSASSSCCGGRRRRTAPTTTTNRSGLTQPLLTNGEATAAADGPCDAAVAVNSAIDDDYDDGSVHDDSSRIQGTKRLISLAAPQIGYLYLGCAVLLVRLPFSLSIPHFISTTLGALSRGDYHQAQTEIILLFILGSIDAVLDFWCVFLFGYAKERIVRGVRVDLLAAILRQDVGFFDRHKSGDLSSRLTSDCGEMAGDLTWFFRFSIESVVRIAGIATYMLIRCPTLGGCALGIVPVVAVINKVYGDWLSKNSIAVQDALAKANSAAQEAFACVRTVIAFAAEDFEHEKYSERIDEHYHLNVLQLMMTGIYYMAVSTFLINTVVQSALLFIGMILIRDGKLTSEILLAFMLYQGQLQNETMNLFNSYSSLIKSSGAGDKVFRLLDRLTPPPGTGSRDVLAFSAPSPLLELENGQATRPAHARSSVQLKDINFVYPARPTHPVLKGLNLNIPSGSTTALVGSSGCGKSTIVALLQRFYDPVAGTILIDNKDLRSMDIKEHRRHVGVVTQDPVLFSGSIFSNITYGCQDGSMEDAMNAAKLANAHSFVTSFPDGYNTEVGERGIALSGGQKQRIAIARAIAKNPSLLLLDEATSALDAESETVVQAALDSLLKDANNRDMTTVVVAHRLRTVRNADCIAYIHDGKVAEQGTHDELMKKRNGYYRRMVDQAGDTGLLPL